MAEQFVSEPLEPVPGTFDTSRMSSGEPGLPSQFRWKSRTISVVTVVRAWKETGACDHGSDEKYVRKHWFELLIDSGETIKVYFERHARGGKSKQRWWLFSISK